MKNISPLLRSAIALGVLAGATQAGLASEKTSENSGQTPPTASNRNVGTRDHAKDIFGKEVRSRDGEKLGDLKDVVVAPDRGKIVYGLVGSGGLLGIGGQVRAVPFDAFKNAYDPSGNLTVDLTRAQWNQIPVLGDDPLASLSDPEFVRSVFSALERQPEHGVAQRSTDDRPNLMRATDIAGKKVVAQGQEVGKIDDVLVSLEHRRASALLDPNNDITNTDQKLIIGFKQLKAQMGKDAPLVTDYTPDQLRRAAPARDNWWSLDSTYPYALTGYGTMAATTYSEEGAGVATTDRARPRTEGRPTANVVAGAIHADAELPENARRGISVQERDGKLVLTGTVESAATKERVAQTARQAAEGRWQIDNQIQIRAATE